MSASGAARRRGTRAWEASWDVPHHRHHHASEVNNTSEGALSSIQAMDPQSVAPEEGGGSRGSPPQPAAVQGTITDELRKLADLKQQGLLTDEEFSTAKAKLLARMAPPAQVPVRRPSCPSR